jgi:hypothetical protein
MIGERTPPIKTERDTGWTNWLEEEAKEAAKAGAVQEIEVEVASTTGTDTPPNKQRLDALEKLNGKRLLVMLTSVPPIDGPMGGFTASIARELER